MILNSVVYDFIGSSFIMTLFGTISLLSTALASGSGTAASSGGPATSGGGAAASSGGAVTWVGGRIWLRYGNSFFYVNKEIRFLDQENV